MARLRYNGLASGSGGSEANVTLGGSLTNSATSVTFAAALTYGGGTAVPTISGSDYLPLSILNSNGKVREVVHLTAYTSGATTGTIARGKEGTTGVSHASGATVQQGALVDDCTGVLAVKKYAPASFTEVSTTSASFVDVDATNLVITFTAPPSGNVLVTLEANTRIGGTGAAIQWALRDGSTTVTNSMVQVVYDLNASSVRRTATIYLTGLTPRQSYTWKWAWLRFVGAGTPTVYMAFGGDAGGAVPALMVVTAAP